MKGTAFDIAENLSASLFVYIYKDIHPLTSLMKKKKNLWVLVMWTVQAPQRC